MSGANTVAGDEDRSDEQYCRNHMGRLGEMVQEAIPAAITAVTGVGRCR